MLDLWSSSVDPWRSQPIRRGDIRLARMNRAWDDDERAALVALLRTRPAKLTWADITAEVTSRRSAQAFWDELHPAGLFDHTEDPDACDVASGEPRTTGS